MAERGTVEYRLEKKQKTCKHFNGTMQKVCRAGINYDSILMSRDTGRSFLLPCIKEELDEVCLCALAEFPSREDAEAFIAECERHSRDVRTARAAIVAHTGGQRRVQGSVKCPVCEPGNLHFSVAYNGHIHAKCSTPGCVCWME